MQGQEKQKKKVQCKKTNYFSVSEYYKKLFGKKVYKICLDAGCTCPTRDGTKGFGGCIFCSEAGSGEFVANRSLSISVQIEDAKKLVVNKIKNYNSETANFIAYFQNFANTYGDEDLLIQKYTESLENSEVVGISIATRPDCLTDSILQKINELSKKKFLCGKEKKQKYFSIEFGLQTSFEKTAEYIRRRFSNAEYIDAINRIKKINKNIHIVTHLIFGLPGESEKQMLESVKFVIDAGTDGIKLQVLNVLRGTDLEKRFLAGEFKTLQMSEYFLLIKKALSIIPQNVVIHRLTGDGAKKLLIAPEWVADKKRVMNALTKMLNE